MPHWAKFVFLMVFAVFPCAAEKVLFEEDFAGALDEGWTWIREHPEAWRTGESGLELRVEPGNLWGGANNARNVLVRPLPEIEEGALVALVTIENTPTHQYEQVNLVWYYDDSHMVKIGLELVHGQRCLVMGREENDRGQTLALEPVESDTLQVRLEVRGDEIAGQYRIPGEADWRDAGKGVLPAKGAAKISLQAYQGPPDEERWARIRDFRLLHIE